MSSEHYKKSIAALQHHLSIFPNDNQAKTELAQYLVSTGKFNDCIGLVASILNEDPHSIDARICLTKALIELGFDSEAEVHLSTLRALGCNVDDLTLLQMRLGEVMGRSDSVLELAADMLRRGIIPTEGCQILDRIFLCDWKKNKNISAYQLATNSGVREKNWNKKYDRGQKLIDLVLVCGEGELICPLHGFSGPGLNGIGTFCIVGKKQAVLRTLRHAIAASIPRLSTYFITEDQPLQSALNDIISGLRADHIGFMNTDILATGEHVRQLSCELVDSPSAGMAAGLFVSLEFPGHGADPFRDGTLSTLSKLSLVNLDASFAAICISGYVPMIHSGLVVLSRQYCIETRGFNSEIEDFDVQIADLSLRMASKGMLPVLSSTIRSGHFNRNNRNTLTLHKLAASHSAEQLIKAHLALHHSMQVRAANKIAGRAIFFA